MILIAKSLFDMFEKFPKDKNGSWINVLGDLCQILTASRIRNFPFAEIFVRFQLCLESILYIFNSLSRNFSSKEFLKSKVNVVVCLNFGF